MARPHSSCIPTTGASDSIDYLGMMMLSSPTFTAKSGFFANRHVDSVSHALNEALRLVQGKLGKAFYIELREMSDRMRAHFEADPEDKTGDTRKGQALIPPCAEHDSWVYANRLNAESMVRTRSVRHECSNCTTI